MLFVAEILIKHYTLKVVQMFTLISMNIISLSIVCQELGIQKQAKKIVCCTSMFSLQRALTCPFHWKTTKLLGFQFA